MPIGGRKTEAIMERFARRIKGAACATTCTPYRWIVVILILVFFVIRVSVAYKYGIIGLALGGRPHLIGWLLIRNAIGLLLVGIGWCRWKKKAVNWPIRKQIKRSKKNLEPRQTLLQTTGHPCVGRGNR
jgi:hypothetical protein